MKIKNVEVQKRREEAFAKAKALQYYAKREEYVFDKDKQEIVFTTGKYTGMTMAQVWAIGPEERDYVASQVGVDTDLDIRKLFLQLLCK